MSHIVTAKVMFSQKSLKRALQELRIEYREVGAEGSDTEIIFFPKGACYSACYQDGELRYDDMTDQYTLNSILQKAAYYEILEAAEKNGFQVNRVDLLEDGTIQVEFLDLEG